MIRPIWYCCCCLAEHAQSIIIRHAIHNSSLRCTAHRRSSHSRLGNGVHRTLANGTPRIALTPANNTSRIALTGAVLWLLQIPISQSPSLVLKRHLLLYMLARSRVSSVESRGTWLRSMALIPFLTNIQQSTLKQKVVRQVVPRAAQRQSKREPDHYRHRSAARSVAVRLPADPQGCCENCGVLKPHLPSLGV